MLQNKGGFKPKHKNQDAADYMNKIDKSFPKWRDHSATVRHRHRMSSNWMPWSENSEFKPKLHSVAKTARVLELINVAWGARLGSNDGSLLFHDLRRNFFCDLSQSIEREPWGKLGTVTTSASFCLKCFEKEHMHVHPRVLSTFFVHLHR